MKGKELALSLTARKKDYKVKKSRAKLSAGSPGKNLGRRNRHYRKWSLGGDLVGIMISSWRGGQVFYQLGERMCERRVLHRQEILVRGK